MRICVCGAPEHKKTEFVNSFLKEWPMYKLGGQSYTDIINSTFKKGKRGNKDTQKKLINALVDSLKQYRKDNNVIFDGSPLDNFVHTLWLKGNDKGKIEDEFISETLSLVKKSMSYIDIIFFIPTTKHAQSTVREDSIFSLEIDNLLKAIKYDWLVNKKSNLFDPEDRPVIIDVFGTLEERLSIAKLYITESGDPYGDGAIITDEDIRLAESLRSTPSRDK